MVCAGYPHPHWSAQRARLSSCESNQNDMSGTPLGLAIRMWQLVSWIYCFCFRDQFLCNGVGGSGNEFDCHYNGFGLLLAMVFVVVVIDLAAVMVLCVCVLGAFMSPAYTLGSLHWQNNKQRTPITCSLGKWKVDKPFWNVVSSQRKTKLKLKDPMAWAPPIRTQDCPHNPPQLEATCA